MNASFHHESVLSAEVIDFLRPAMGRTIVDGTLGGGGHSSLLLHGGARVVGFDRDPDALHYSRKKLTSYGDLFTAVEGNFAEAPRILATLGIEKLDGILLDLGVSSHQLDTAERGFSFQSQGPLDMRMAKSGLTAADIVNTLEASELARIFREYGDEPRAIQFAARIVRARQHGAISSTRQLAELIAAGRSGPRHPATRVFQALRIAVNDEIGSLERALPSFGNLLAPGGRMAVITFHSLEDRIVKHFFRRHSLVEIDDPTWPSARPNPDLLFDTLTPRSITASPVELERNPRSRSARLRVVERLLTPQKKGAA
ncbi:MAG: 16S rRNA (cytosine(1402)-N(4))-methyltransferase RsmH [Verrucomicrobia bacterium]|nr:MAG: 16S rRNA (cytosine(1402)-N(4))-methyltransferase RsmH [Verrucomicrobiota bacterium]